VIANVLSGNHARWMRAQIACRNWMSTIGRGYRPSPYWVSSNTGRSGEEYQMLIWGTRSKEETVESGTFYCPHCRVQSGYSLKAIARYAHVFFIPMFKRRETGIQFVICHSCSREFDMDVLTKDEAYYAGKSQPWECPRCQNVNPGNHTECMRCNTWQCGNCGYGNASDLNECLRCRQLR
jgi:hypothetical protein